MRRRHDFPQMTAAQNARICGGNPIERSSVARAQSSGSVSSADLTWWRGAECATRSLLRPRNIMRTPVENPWNRPGIRDRRFGT